MSVTIKYFASLREQLGRHEEHITINDKTTVRDVWHAAVSTPPPPNTLVAVNLEYAEWDTAVSDGDEVGFFPPVTGG